MAALPFGIFSSMNLNLTDTVLKLIFNAKVSGLLLGGNNGLKLLKDEFSAFSKGASCKK